MTSTTTIKGNFIPSEDLTKLDPSFINAVIFATLMKEEGVIRGTEGTYTFQKSKVGSFETITFGDSTGKGIGMIMTDLRSYKHRILEDKASDFYGMMLDITEGEGE